LILSNDGKPLSGVACQRRGSPVETSRTKEKVLLPEGEVALNQIDKQLDTMKRKDDPYPLVVQGNDGQRARIASSQAALVG
jgi:hypothetical protein